MITDIYQLFRSWDRDPATSTIQRVRLSELDFPAITVCPDYATDSLAYRTSAVTSLLKNATFF